MEFNPFSLKNKTILITGASSGIGRETAIVFSKLGAKTILLSRDKKRLEETKDSLINSEVHLIIPIDLSDYDQIESNIQKLKKEVNKLDGIVHCAGISSTIPLRSINEKKLQDHFDINVNASIILTKFLLSRKISLVNEGASIVFISSVMANVGEVGKTVYAMTKGALIAGVKSLAIELALKHIRVNAISPGVVVTPLSSASFYSQNQERLNKVRSLHPLGLGKPEDVANACAYLISDASGWVTGTNLIVDGGYTAR